MREDRNRQLEALTDFDRQGPNLPTGNTGVLLKTFTQSVYPTAAASVFACHPCNCDADDTEGAAPSFAVDSSQIIFALNIGATVPASGSLVIGISTGGRVVFAFT